MSAFYNVDQPPFNMGSAARAIAAANNGLLFDLSDMSTMYQDANGTIPVTAVEQPVGKIIDKSGNGNHATQSVTASRPVLSARYNLLTDSENFNNWGKTSSVSIVGGVITDSGTGDNYAYKTLNITSDSSTYTGVVCLPKTPPVAVYPALLLAAIGGAVVSSTCVFNTHTGEFTNIGGPLPIVVDNGDSWLIYKQITNNSTNTILNYRIYPSYNYDMSTTRNNAAVGSIAPRFADLRLGTSAGPYQRVNTATDYDTDERYFPKYLRFDAVDDHLNLPFMNLYNGGAESIICARDAVSQATDTYIISERSTTDTDPKYFPSRQLASGGNMDAYIADDNAAVVLDTVGSPFGGVANAVIRSIVDSGSNLKLFKNGVLAANDNYTRSGTLTLNNTTIGASVSTTTSNYAKMKLYGLLITKSALSDAQRVRCERFLARKAGAML